MSADKFDKELSDLYQQRKQQIDAPNVNLASGNKLQKSRRSPWHILALLLTGGIASFGIMALVTHLAKPSVHGVNEQYKQHSVRVIELTEVKIEEKTIPVASPPLPPKPTSTTPTIIDNAKPEALAISVKPTISLNNSLENSLNVPTINQPKISIKPIYRVMPEYPKTALYARKSGTVKLQYRIADTGKVVDIKSVNQPGDRILERSAKQALAKWRYSTANASDKLLEVEFEFNLK